MGLLLIGSNRFAKNKCVSAKQPFEMNYILETERIKVRWLTMDDTKFIIELLNSPGWIKFIGDRNVKTEDQAKKYLESGPLKSYADNVFGLSLVELKNEKRPIGMCGIIKRDHLESPDIGFAFLPEFIGKGLAFEVAKATMTYAKQTLKLPEILAITLPDNKLSIKLLEKIGMRFIKIFSFPNDNEQLSLYSSK
jgi:RimJ/RimL family protein N-acetyltransferase